MQSPPRCAAVAAQRSDFSQTKSPPTHGNTSLRALLQGQGDSAARNRNNPKNRNNNNGFRVVVVHRSLLRNPRRKWAAPVRSRRCSEAKHERWRAPVLARAMARVRSPA